MCMFIMLWLSSFLLSVYKIVEHGNTVFSLNFSSAGKGPFMDGKAKNIYFSKRGGGGDSGVRDMDPPSLGNFLFPYFKTYFTQIFCRYL